MDNEVLEELGLLVDKLESLQASMAITAIPDRIHVEAMRDQLPEIQGRLKQAYFELGGEDVWCI